MTKRLPLPLLLPLLLLPCALALRQQLPSDDATSYMDASADSCPSRPERFGYRECPRGFCVSDRDCQSQGSQARCVCDRELCGRVCVRLGIGCHYLKELVNGVKLRQNNDWNEHAAGQVIRFDCNQGYRLDGPRQIACQANLKWTDQPPVCVPKSAEKCGRPKLIPNTDIQPFPDQEQYEADKVFRYSCARGFRADRPGLEVSATCTKGVWNMQDIACTIISCGHPGTPSNGRMMNKNFTFGNKVTFFCNERYKMNCTNPEHPRSECEVRTCLENGTWSGSQPRCEPVKCPPLRSPPNGLVTKSQNTANSIVGYECNVGYKLVGKVNRMCQLNGQWDGEEPICRIQDCGPPPIVPNAYKPVYRSTRYEARATYTCMPDTKFEGENQGQTMCQKSGIWYPPPPRCRSHCEVPIIHLGKPLIGSYDGKEAVGKVPSDTTLWIKCHENYRLEQIIYPRCDNGSWTKIPRCVPKDCEDRPPLINKGIARFYGTSHKDKVDYRCYVGYEITRGSRTLECKFGKWVGKVPKCSRKQCPWIDSGAGIHKWLIGVKGAKNPWTRPETRANHEEIVAFKCKAKGYILQGHTHAICINGEWRPPGSPTCVPQMHKRIPAEWLYYRGG